MLVVCSLYLFLVVNRRRSEGRKVVELSYEGLITAEFGHSAIAVRTTQSVAVDIPTAVGVESVVRSVTCGLADMFRGAM